jgi:TolA-binding protein
MKRKFMLCVLGMLAATLVLAMSVKAADKKPFAVPLKAVNLIEQGRFDDAYKELADFRKREPDNPWGLYYLAAIEQDYLRALWLYKEVERLGDSTMAADALFKRAEITYSVGKFAEADSLYQVLGVRYPGTGPAMDALYRRGNISLEQSDPATAIEFFTACIGKDSTDTRCLYARAGIMEAQVLRGDWQAAIDAGIAVLAEKDDMSMFTPRVLEVIALSWKNLGNEENAAKFTERLLQNYPFSQQAYTIREQADAANVSGQSGDDTAIEGTGPAAPAVEGADFTVQTGAFTDRTNALKLMQTLQGAGFDPRVEMRTVKDTHFYVIRVGYFTTREQADAMAAQITAKTGAQSNVVVLE